MSGQNQYAQIAVPYKTLEYNAPNWHISGVRADNPTTQWFLIKEMGRYISPKTMGVIISIAPSVQRLTIVPSSPPPGGIANGAASGTLQLQFLEDSDADDTGLDYSLVPALSQLDTDIVALIAAINNLSFGTGANKLVKVVTAQLNASNVAATIIAAIGGSTHHVVMVVFSNNVASSGWPRGYITTTVFGGAVTVAVGNIGGEQPTVVIPVPPDAGNVGIGQDVKAIAQGLNESTSHNVDVTIYYYTTTP